MSILEFLLYLIYGFSMITMGIFAVMQKDSRLMNETFAYSQAQ